MEITDSLQKLTINTKMFFHPISSHDLYEEKIRSLLQKMSEGINDLQSLVIDLREFKIFTSELRMSKKETRLQDIQYTALINLINCKEVQFKVLPLFSQMSKFILDQEQHFKTRKIQILQQYTNSQIQLTKEEVIYMMCLMALNLVPLQDYDYEPNRRDNFPFWKDFSYIFSESDYKIRTVMSYFDQHFNNKQWIARNQRFIIRRKYLTNPLDKFIDQNSKLPMSPYQIQSNDTSIQSFTGSAKVDFANKYIGGGALHEGCVQQEIMFSNHPQLFISGIFCQVMLDEESIFLEGFRKYSKNNGYGFTVNYGGQQTINQSTFKTQQYIIAIDAIHFEGKRKLKQFDKEMIDRQLAKAYAGFSNLPEKIDVVTGNWGCGVFNGDVKVKFLIQWLACSMAQKKMIYCPFGSRQTLENNKKVLQELSKKTVGQVYDLLIEGGKQMKNIQWNIFQLINQVLEKRKTLKAIF